MNSDIKCGVMKKVVLLTMHINDCKKPVYCPATSITITLSICNLTK